MLHKDGGASHMSIRPSLTCLAELALPLGHHLLALLGGSGQFDGLLRLLAPSSASLEALAACTEVVRAALLALAAPPPVLADAAAAALLALAALPPVLVLLLSHFFHGASTFSSRSEAR